VAATKLYLCQPAADFLTYFPPGTEFSRMNQSLSLLCLPFTQLPHSQRKQQTFVQSDFIPRSNFKVYIYFPFIFWVTYSFQEQIHIPEGFIHVDRVGTRYWRVNISFMWPASWSSGQSFWLLITRSRVRFPVLTWGFFLVGEDSHGYHGLGSLAKLRFKAPPSTSYSCITIHLIGTT
jgi:hypothetical protein